jgi:tetratricopeptide (TPR) repeat protein
MIKAVSEPHPEPVVLVPVAAEDFARRKRRLIAACVAAAVAIGASAGILYKRSVDPIRAQESYDAGVRLYRIARYPHAILSFSRAIDLKPGFADAYFLRAEAYVAESYPEKAIPDFTKVIELEPGNPRALLSRGSVYLNLKDFAAALADSTRAIALDPELAQAYNLRGLAVRSAGDPKKALDDFNRAVQLAPNVDNYFQRGSTYQMLGEHRLAIPDFDLVIAFKPDQAQVYFARAEARRAIGDLAGANKDHQRGRLLDGL